MEIFKDIKGYEGLYQVSNTGRVKSLCRYVMTAKGPGIRKEKFLNPCNEKGYSRVSLGKNNKHKMFSVHRLVAQAFLGLDINDKKLYVLHKSETMVNGRFNNTVENLWLGTHSDNMMDMVKKGRNFCPTKGLTGIKNFRTKLNEYQILRIKLMLDIGDVSQKSIGKFFGCSQDYISRIKTGAKFKEITF